METKTQLDERVFQYPIVLVIAIILFGFLFVRKDESLCDGSLLHAYLRQMHHGNVTHLMANLGAFASLTYSIQNVVGSYQYLAILITISVLSGLIDYWLTNQTIISVQCSIGFSGVVFGLLGWSLAQQRGFNKQLLIDLALLMYPSLTTPNISFSGHLIGLLAGLIAFLLFPPI